MKFIDNLVKYYRRVETGDYNIVGGKRSISNGDSVTHHTVKRVKGEIRLQPPSLGLNQIRNVDETDDTNI